MPFDLSSPQLNVWMAISTRPDVIQILLRNPMVYSTPELAFLMQAGIDPVNDASVIAMVQAATPHKSAMFAAAGNFHAILQVVLSKPYPPPNCPADAQLNCLSHLPCQENPAETAFSRQFAELMSKVGPPILAPIR